MKKIFLFAAVFLLAGAGISGAAVNMTGYLPLATGNSWTYQVQGFSMTITNTVLSGTLNINGVDTKIVQSSQGIREYFTNDGNGIRKHRNFYPAGLPFPEAVTMTFVPPFSYANAQWDIGNQVSTTGRVDVFVEGYGQVALNFQGTSTFEGLETVSVPAGTFPAIRLRAIAQTWGTIEGEYFYLQETMTFWFVNRVGLVKQIVVSTDGIDTDTQTLVLTQTNVPIPFRGFFDYDGNRIADVAAYHHPTNQFFTRSAGNLGQYGWGQDDSMPLVWDYNGDGRTELSFYHIPTNQWFAQTYPGHNMGGYGWGGDECIPVPGDYNGDGRMERGFYHWPSNRWFVEGQPEVQFGYDGAASIPIAGDFDGDGKTDMVIYHINSNQWFMHGVGHLGQFGWGGADCIPAPGDWDGDGKMEIGIYHVPSNQWFYRDSAGTTHFMGQYGWEGAASFPIPADYDGDLAAEKGIYRPAGNQWVIEGLGSFEWGWGGEDFMPVTSQTAVYNWYRFQLLLFQ